MTRLACFALAALLTGCASAPPSSYGVCATEPGSYACQIERYQNAF